MSQDPFEKFLNEVKREISGSLSSYSFNALWPTEYKDYLNTSPTFQRVELRLERAMSCNCEPFKEPGFPDYLTKCLFAGNEPEPLIQMAKEIKNLFPDEDRVVVNESVPQMEKDEADRRQKVIDFFSKDIDRHFVLIVASYYSELVLDRRKKLGLIEYGFGN